MSVMIVTSLGDLVVDLFTDRCPLTCKNFLKLCKIKYYNGCLFHMVQKDFTAQTGDPTGTGSGGDSVYKFLYGEQARFFGDEIHLDVKHSKMGTVAMASAGENMNASQFYFTLRDDLDYLDGKHTVVQLTVSQRKLSNQCRRLLTVFGEIAEGLDTLTRINEAYVDEKSRPYKNIRIKHTYILDDPFDDPPQLADLIPDASPEGKPKDEVDDDVRLEDDWVPLDEQLNPHELEEMMREKDAHSRAVVLETIGDIPEAEVKPPDNVLFVCKLNPVTEDEDLNTIFSRFGVVTSAEVIRDHKTGDSLCYAFIEFEDREACEQAYFKMDNALIDDRRIHVDFSQSVSKLWSQYRRKGGKMGQGGCFKCGSVDHIAKDCTGDSTTKQLNSKYTLKEDNTQRGGNGSTRYDMVFEEDDDRGRHKKRRRDNKSEQYEEKRNSKDRDDRRRDRHDQEGRHERSKERREDEGYVKRQRSPYRGGTKDPEKNGTEKREQERRHGDDVGHNKHRREYDKRKYENETKKRSDEDFRGSHRDNRHDNYADRRRGEERYSDKRSSRDDDLRVRDRW